MPNQATPAREEEPRWITSTARSMKILKPTAWRPIVIRRRLSYTYIYWQVYPVTINFTPHLVPMNRGILVTAYASLKKQVTEEQIRDIYHRYYDKEQFVRVLDPELCPQTKWVEGSNYVDVNVKLDPRTGRVIMMGAMDNLVKGAAGQAVQNMNLMFGLEEKYRAVPGSDVSVRKGEVKDAKNRRRRDSGQRISGCCRCGRNQKRKPERYGHDFQRSSLCGCRYVYDQSGQGSAGEMGSEAGI